MTEIPHFPVDFAAVKKRQQQTWASGDFSKVASAVTIVGEMLCEAADLHSGEKVLDVATGSGNTAISAARRWCEVTGVDFVPSLLDRARERAAAERLPVTFREGDTENLPFPASSFDVVLSTFGAMFAPNQEMAARELLRVCRPGGRIGMANWTPRGFAGELFLLTSKHVPPPPGLKPPVQWGTEERLRELFGDQISSLRVATRQFKFRSRSPDQWLEFMRTYFGPTLKAFEALDNSGKSALASDLRELVRRFNRSDDDTLVAPSDYLEIVATKT